MTIKDLILIILILLNILYAISLKKLCLAFFDIVENNLSSTFELNKKVSMLIDEFIEKEKPKHKIYPANSVNLVNEIIKDSKKDKRYFRTEEQRKAASEKRRQWWAEKKARETRQ